MGTNELHTNESPQAAAQHVVQAQHAVEQGELDLRLLRQSRAAFIQSLRATGLTYAQARTKYDNCLEEQLRLHQAAVDTLQYAQRRHESLTTPAP